jgi:trans-aconitate methyltransferase
LLHNTTSKARLVQRRETAQGGMGTKVILNLALGPETHITIRSEGSLQLVTPSNTKALLFVLKAKPIHIQKLHTLLQTLIPNSSLAVKSNDDNHDDNKEDKNKEDNNKKDNNKKDNNKTAENTPQDTTTLE